MMRQRLAGRLFPFIAVTALSVASAEASLIQFGNRAAFAAQGTISENYGFEDWGSTGGFAYAGDPYAAHGVTYSSTQTIIVKPDLGYGNSSNVIINNYWTPISGAISGSYNMLGFDLGILGSDSLIDFSITTSLAVYSFTGVSVPNVNTGMTFFGFIAGPGEVFSQMDFASQSGWGYAPALDNVTLGTTEPGTVPEPGTLLLICSGLVALAARRRSS
jgi:hypothetical protein